PATGTKRAKGCGCWRTANRWACADGQWGRPSFFVVCRLRRRKADDTKRSFAPPQLLRHWSLAQFGVGIFCAESTTSCLTSTSRGSRFRPSPRIAAKIEGNEAESSEAVPKCSPGSESG